MAAVGSRTNRNRPWGKHGEQAEDQGQRPCPFGDGVARYAAFVRPAQRAAPARAALRLRPRPVRRVLGAAGREGDPELRDPGRGGLRQEHHDAGGAAGAVGEGARHDGFEPGAASVAAGVDRRAGAALRLLPERHDDPGRGPALDDEEPDRGADPHRDERPPVPLRHLSADPDRDQAGGRGDGEGRQVMTGLLHERELSRKSFLAGGGALVVGFGMAGAAVAGKAQAAESPFASHGPYDLSQIDSWIVIHGDDSATIKLGKVELGQGSATGLLMIAGEELDMDLSQLRHIHHDTDVTPNQGTTAGSRSIQTGGKQLRAAAAAAKSTLLALASKELGVPVSSLSVKSGVVSGGDKTVTYGQLIGDKLFNVKMAPGYKVSGTGGFGGPPGLAAGAPLTKPVGQYRLVGTSPPRIDIPDKISGKYTYVHNIKVPGMLHGRVVRPRGQGAYGGGTAPAVLSVDESSIGHIPSVRVVRHGNF